MKKAILGAAALAALLILPACADTGYYGAGYGADMVYYDGYYGPYSDGYWGPDSYFYYRGSDGRFFRDEARHYRRDRFDGARAYRWHGRDRDRDDYYRR